MATSLMLPQNGDEMRIWSRASVFFCSWASRREDLVCLCTQSSWQSWVRQRWMSLDVMMAGTELTQTKRLLNSFFFEVYVCQKRVSWWSSTVQFMKGWWCEWSCKNGKSLHLTLHSKNLYQIDSLESREGIIGESWEKTRDRCCLTLNLRRNTWTVLVHSTVTLVSSHLLFCS
jgi:hypothetical protein